MNDKNIMRKHFQERFVNGGKETEMSLIPPLPSSLNIELNSTCNHKCVFCPYHSDHATGGIGAHVMAYETAVRILDEAARLGIGKKEVGFYVCGEPFLYKKLPEVVAYAKKKGFAYTFLTSNGALATPERMKAVVDAGLDSIRFSVNAPTRELYREIHGRDDSDQVYENIKYLAAYRRESRKNIAISLSCVLNKKTVGMQDMIRERFGELVDDIIFIPIIIRPEMAETLAEYGFGNEADRVPRKGFVCKPVFNCLYIDAACRVLACCEVYGEEEGVVYDLNEKLDLEAAWRSEEFQRYRKRFLEQEELRGTICEHCYLATLNQDDGLFREG